MNHLQVHDFCRAYSKATLLLHIATTDYATARCAMINGLAGGFGVGAQAIEKYLKAMILLADYSANIRGMKHYLVRLLAEAERCIPELSSHNLLPVAQRFTQYYQARYPDNPNQPSGMDTRELHELDRFVMAIYAHLPCPRNVKFRTGLYASITFSLNENSPNATPTEHWIKKNNVAIFEIWPDIVSQYPMVMQELHPRV